MDTTGVSDSASETANSDVLRFLTCGSVDDGKSTLIGRLLHDTRLVPDDQLATLEAESRQGGGTEIDYSLLLDGLQAEREQGITIDVAYRFFATDTRKYVVADTPGHEQYTRNMATGASTADVAVILTDARKGVLSQTRRHTYIAHLLGIRHIILAVNKMDLVDHDRSRFLEICSEYAKIADGLGFDSIAQIPISAKNGDNIIKPSEAMRWHEGPTLLEQLEAVEVTDRRRQLPFRMPVQWVNRAHQDFRGFSGNLISGTLRPGDALVVAASGQTSKLKRIVTVDGDPEVAYAGDAVTLVLEDEIDISRGDVMAEAKTRPTVSTQFAANLLWMSEEEMNPGRSYLLKIGANMVSATVTVLKHKLDINTMEHRPARTLALNEIGLVNVQTGQPIVFDPYAEIRQSGAFILIDRYTNKTAGAGMIRHALRRADNIHRHSAAIDKTARASVKGHKPAIIWFTGLSASGKSTIANRVEQDLHQRGVHSFLLDGDNIRHGLCCDLGFSEADRVENIRRVGEVARLFVEAGLVVVCSFISPFRAERRHIRELLDKDEFIEIFIDTPLDVCIKRDPKGLYKKAKAGEIPNFTGIDSPYEAPENPELRFDTSRDEVESIAASISDYLCRQGIIG